MLDRIEVECTLQVRGVHAFWPASGEGEDVVLYTDETRETELARLPMLRQQHGAERGQPDYALSDFVAPLATGLPDHVGGFAVTAGIGAAEAAAAYEAELDDYNSILLKALADRLAEAFAELLHRRARTAWGYGGGEDLAVEDMLRERFRGIRPAYCYPACPDHGEKRTLFELLGAREVGLDLTESYAMTPAASVSGLYFAHPRARYFSVGRIGKSQVEDYARRKGEPIALVERRLSSNLAYDR